MIELLSGFDGRPRSRVRELERGFLAEPEDMFAAPALAELLSLAPVAIDELIRQTGSSPGAVHMALLELEIAGRLARHAGAKVSLAG